MAFRTNDFHCNDCDAVSEILYNTDKISEVKCESCGSTNLDKMLAAPKISYEGDKTLRQRTPDGFKDVLKSIKGGTPDKFREANMSVID